MKLRFLIFVLVITCEQVFGDDADLLSRYDTLVKENNELQTKVVELQTQIIQNKKSAADFLKVVESRETYMRTAMAEERKDHTRQIEACRNGLEGCQMSLHECKPTDNNMRILNGATNTREFMQCHVSLHDCSTMRDELLSKVAKLETQLLQIQQTSSGSQRDELEHRVIELEQKLLNHVFSTRKTDELYHNLTLSNVQHDDLSQQIAAIEQNLQKQLSFLSQHEELSNKVSLLENHLQNQLSSSLKSDKVEKKLSELEMQLQNQQASVWDGALTSQQNLLQSKANIVQLGDRKYLFVIKQMSTWFEASSYCNLLGMNLVNIETQQENDLIMSHLKKIGSEREFVFTGGNKLGWTDFSWISGAPITFSDWARGQPDFYDSEHCLVLLNTHWHNLGCSSRAKFICEQR